MKRLVEFSNRHGVVISMSEDRAKRATICPECDGRCSLPYSYYSNPFASFQGGIIWIGTYYHCPTCRGRGYILSPTSTVEQPSLEQGEK